MSNKKVNIAEKYTSILNVNFFLKEFTFTKNELKPDNEKQEIELADNIVWLDNILYLIQIKWRNPEHAGDSENEKKWFRSKVLKVAKNQIKSTLKYLARYSKLEIANGRGVKRNLSEIPLQHAKKIIIYLPSNNISDEDRFLKFCDSKSAGLVHLFHFEDYKWICQYLVTPSEITSYLQFRERMMKHFGTQINSIPEQLILGKYLSGKSIRTIDSKFISYLHSFKENINEFDIFPFLSNFVEKSLKLENKTDYIFIIKEIAKLSRFEVLEFKKRLLLSIEKSKTKEYTIPYRISIPSTECGFVFIPISLEEKNFRDNWKIALKNFTVAHKYDQKLNKCIGAVVFRKPESIDYVEIYWMFIEFKWEEDKLMEQTLENSFPFREVKAQKLDGYKFNT